MPAGAGGTKVSDGCGGVGLPLDIPARMASMRWANTSEGVMPGGIGHEPALAPVPC